LKKERAHEGRGNSTVPKTKSDTNKRENKSHGFVEHESGQIIRITAIRLKIKKGNKMAKNVGYRTDKIPAYH
jgi:hypothetical protein